MPTDSKAHLFWVISNEVNVKQMRKLIADFCADPSDIEFSVGPNDFTASEMSWDPKQGAFTVSVFKVRASDLPAAIDEDEGVQSLDLEEDTNLGEPIVFAYYPDYEVAIVQYNHSGPQHPVVRAVLNAIGHEGPIHMSPVLRQDMVEQLETASIFRSLEFSLQSPKQQQELAAAGSSVKEALSMLENIGGVNVTVKVTMGHQKGTLLDGVKNTAKKLSEIGDSDLGTLKVNAASNENAPVEQLDLLKARIVREFEVKLTGREMDREDCGSKLRSLFASLKEDVQAQRKASMHRVE